MLTLIHAEIHVKGSRVESTFNDLLYRSKSIVYFEGKGYMFVYREIFIKLEVSIRGKSSILRYLGFVRAETFKLENR